MKLTKEQRDAVKKAAKANSIKIKDLDFEGAYPDEKAMGSGGVGQVKVLPRAKEIRLQLTYGKGRHNYAHVIIVPFNS